MKRCIDRAALLLSAAAVLAVWFASGCDAAHPPEAESLRLVMDSARASAPTTDVGAQNGAVYFSWFGEDGAGRPAVYVSTLSPADSIPTAAVRVNPDDVTVNPHPQAPAQIAAGHRGDLVYVAWSTRMEIEGRRFPASDVVLARSEDGGRTFDFPVPVNDDAGGYPAGHTFHDLAVGPDGTVYVSWLDSRDDDRVEDENADSAPHDTGGHHSHAKFDYHHDGAFSGTDVRVSRSVDGGRTFSESTVVARGSCQCCRTALFVGDDHTVYLAWRHIYEDNVRDIAFASSKDGGRTFSAPIRVHTDGWRIDGCPHSGPSLAVEPSGTIHLSWYTAAVGEAGIRYATSTDGGRRFSDPRPIESDVPLAITQVAGGDRIPVWVAWEDPLVNQICAAPAGTSPTTSDQKLTFAGTMPAIAAAGGVRSVVWQRGGAVEAYIQRDRTAMSLGAARGIADRR